MGNHNNSNSAPQEPSLSARSNDGILHEPRPKLTYWDHSVIALAEFFGTAFLIFLSCTACTFGVQGAISSMHVSLGAGLAVMLAIQIFGHISGAHINPVVTMAALILNEVTSVQVPVYLISQVLGSLAGYGFQMLVTPEQHSGIAAGGRGVCVTAPHADVTDWQALGVEIILTIAMVSAVCSSWDRRNCDKMDSVPLRIGLVVAVANLAAGAYTGASMNPMRSFGPAVWTNDFGSHWVYWVGPTIGSLLASCFYKFVVLRKT